MVFFFWLRSKASRGLGVEGVFARRCRPQPFGTVRVRTVWPCLWRALQKWSFLEVSKISSLHFAWQAQHLWHSNKFHNVSKPFCVAGAILLCRFWKMSCVFRGSRSTMVTSMVILRGRSTSDASCCVFYKHGIVRDAANGCRMWWKLTKALRETSILR